MTVNRALALLGVAAAFGLIVGKAVDRWLSDAFNTAVAGIGR